MADHLGLKYLDARTATRSDDDLSPERPRQTPQNLFRRRRTRNLQMDVYLPSHFPRALPRPAPGRPLGHGAVAEYVASIHVARNVLSPLSSAKLTHHVHKANVSSATHESWNWTARVLPGMKRGRSFHLHLFNADDPSRGRCHSNSSLFEIAQPGSSAAGDQSVNSKSQTLPLGLGLELGLPLTVLPMAFATWLCMCRRWGKRRNGEGRSGQSVTDYMRMLPQRKGGKMELQGQAIGELSGLEIVIEAPSNMARLELGGSPGRSQ